MARQLIGLWFMSALLALAANSLRPDGIAWVGDWSPEARIGGNSGGSRVISLEESAERFETGDAIFVDARSAAEYEAGHIQGAISFPWQDFDAVFESVFPLLPEDRPLIVYCDGEACSLSKDLVQALAELGFSNARVLVNGWSVWRAHGLPIEGGGGE
ncbi:MAG: rhodanese-like domain-containing protein [Desulfobacterales bacterium]